MFSYPLRPLPNTYLYIAFSHLFLFMSPDDVYVFIDKSGQKRNVLSLKTSILDLTLPLINRVTALGIGH